MANSIFVNVDNITTNSARIRLGNNTAGARSLTLRVFRVDGGALIYQNNHYLPPHQYIFIDLNNLESSTQYRVSGTYNTEETVVVFTTQTPSRSITGRVNVIKDNLAEIQGRVFVSNQTLAEISGKVTVRVATPEKLPEDWEYSSTHEPEDWSENEKESVNWSSSKEVKPQRWHYPLKDT